MTEQQANDSASMGDVAQKAEHKQQAYESNKRLKTSVQAVSSDRGKHITVLALLCIQPALCLHAARVHNYCSCLALVVNGHILIIPAVTLSTAAGKTLLPCADILLQSCDNKVCV